MNTKTLNQILTELNTNEKGLNSAEVNERLTKNGKNIFPTGKQKNAFFILLNYQRY